MNDILPAYCAGNILILGCGNRLFGDDGFGPAVAEYLLEQYHIPESVYVMDVGTGVRKILFTLCLSSKLPEQIVLIDAVDKGRAPGELFEIPLDEIPFQKTDDFSLHQAPSSNLAKELKERGIDVKVLACQTGFLPQSIQPGLSSPVFASVGKAGEQLARTYELTRKVRAVKRV